MKQFEVKFIKTVKVLGPGTNIPTMAKQIINSDNEKIQINIPLGYVLMSVTEILEPITQINEKKN